MELNVSYFNIIRNKYNNDNNSYYYEYNKYKNLTEYEVNYINTTYFNSLNDLLTYLDTSNKNIMDSIKNEIINNSFNIDIINSYVDNYINNDIQKIEVKFPKDKGNYENLYVNETINTFYKEFND